MKDFIQILKDKVNYKLDYHSSKEECAKKSNVKGVVTMKLEEVIYLSLDMGSDFSFHMIRKLDPSGIRSFLQLCIETRNIRVLQLAVEKKLKLEPEEIGRVSHQIFAVNGDGLYKILRARQFTPKQLAVAYSECAKNTTDQNVEDLLKILKIYLKAGVSTSDIHPKYLIKAMGSDPKTKEFVLSRVNTLNQVSKKGKLRQL